MVYTANATGRYLQITRNSGQIRVDAVTYDGDEDGVPSFPSMLVSSGDTYSVPNIEVHNDTGQRARLCGWLDFDINGQSGDGAFENTTPGDGVSERACVTVNGSPGAGEDPDNGSCTGTAPSFTCQLDFVAPDDFVYQVDEITYARFRLTTASSFFTTSGPSPTGSATDGEVEDYQIEAATLSVSLSGLDSDVYKGQLMVSWSTATEVQNIGFDLFGRKDSEPWQRLNEALIPSNVLDSVAPQRYQVILQADVDELRLEDIDSRNRRRRHGPFAVGVRYGVDAFKAATHINWSAIRADNRRSQSRRYQRRAHANTASDSTTLLWVEHSGIQRLRYEDLQAAGVDLGGVNSADIAVLDRGEGQYRHIEDTDGIFGPGDHIEFLGRVQPTLYSHRNAYTLAINPSQAKAAENQVSQSRGTTHVLDHERVFEQQNHYTFAAPLDDPWYDARLVARTGANHSIRRDFDLPGYAGGDASLRLTVWGITDWPGEAADHHLQIHLNGQWIDEIWYDGQGAMELDIHLSASQLRSDNNTLELTAVADTGFAWDVQTLDKFSVRYQRLSQADDGAWQGKLTDDTNVRVDALQGAAVAWSGRRRRTGRHAIDVQGQGTWWVADQRAIHKPQIERRQIVAQPQAQAAYLIISHPIFIDDLTELEALQHRRGLSTTVISTEAIYAVYSDHEVDAEAIRQFIKQSTAEYILLVGADSYDYHGYLGNNSESLIPTHYVRTSEVVNFAPSDAVHADGDLDGLADRPIGRIPARSVDELQTLLAKLNAYQIPRHSVFSAGGSDADRLFSDISQQYESWLPPSWTSSASYVDDLGLTAAKAQLLDELSQGGNLVSYHGHSSFTIWGSTHLDALLTANEARALHHPLPNIIVQWGCWNTYFVDPNIDTLANAFLFDEDGGAAAVLGATALTERSLLAQLGKRFYTDLDQVDTLGEALLSAQRHIAQEQPRMLDALRGFVLLGDPATPLQP